MDESGANTEDVKAVLLAMAGDAGAFGRLVSLHQTWLVNLLWRMLGDVHAAEDVAQLSFVKAWSNLARLERPDRFRGWLRAIAVRSAIDARKQIWLSTPIDDLDKVADTRVTTEHHDRKLDLAQALSELSIAQRTCVLLSQSEGLTHAEIAELLAMPVGTVKSHVARALAVLRRSLADWKPQ